MSKPMVPVRSPAGLRSLFPGLKARTEKPVVVTLDVGFHEAAGVPIRPGQRFTITGVQRDPSMPKGYRTDCIPGTESVLVMDRKRKSATFV